MTRPDEAFLPVQTLSFNTILYCGRFEETVRFYRDVLNFPPVLVKAWFVEFAVSAQARISVADESRASVKSGGGLGITLTFQVKDLDAVHDRLTASGFEPGPVVPHPWGARLFRIPDPEGHRLEFWSPSDALRVQDFTHTNSEKTPHDLS